MDGSEEKGDGGGVIHNKNVREVERAERGVQGCGGRESKETESEKQSGKIREAPVHCYSFSCSDIIVQFPQGRSRGRRAEGGGQ